MKRRISAILIAALIVISLSGCRTEPEGLTKINLNEVVHSIFYAPQYVAISKGFFKEEGLEINLSVGNGADKTMTAILAGEADIGLLGTEAGLYVYNEGRQDFAVAFAQLTQRAGNFLVSRVDEPDFKWQNVIGKTIIGGRAGGMPQMIIEYILRQNGIDPAKDVEILTNLQFTTTAGAFTGGVGDYTLEFEPSALAIEKAGAGFVVASCGAESGAIPYTVYMASKSYIENNQKIIQSFTNAIQKGMTWVAQHSSEEIAEAIKDFFPESTTDELAFMIERYKAQDTWKESCVFTEDGFELLQDIMEQAGDLSNRVPYKDMITTEFAEKAYESK